MKALFSGDLITIKGKFIQLTCDVCGKHVLRDKADIETHATKVFVLECCNNLNYFKRLYYKFKRFLGV